MTYYKVKSTAKKVSKSVVQNSKKLTKKVALGARAVNEFVKNGFNGRETASAIADFIPIVGNVKGAYEATFGKDPITGRKLDKVERAAAGAAVIGGPLVKGGTRGVKMASGIVSGGKKSSGKVPVGKGIDKNRPSWRQSEIDIGKEYPGYRDQVSYKDGNEISHGTRGSSRPDFYTNGHSIEVKNYKLTTSSGRSNLIRNVSKQVNKRISDLPENTKQTVIIDVRGQNVSRDVLRGVKQKINERTNGVPEIIYKMD